ncbi:hypothetical protein HPB49_010387 [Dermacentor silvarum]|uniref:Uncharacterized protein n=1 Tax=Dermacentor silvarum TaxID=543639 RepID=A0ACB8DJ06_DERSI|nr:hypothetical protein HPB49_010387 [Dermacentor silvarum]
MTTPVCTHCGTVGHRTDMCPNPHLARCSTCGTLNPEGQAQCHAKCSVCNGLHLMGSTECKRKHRRAIGGQRERSQVRNANISSNQRHRVDAQHHHHLGGPARRN